MSISDMKLNNVYIIKELDCSDKLKSHLIGMGFIPGSNIVLLASRFGGYVIECLGGKYALDRNMAKKIIICEKNDYTINNNVSKYF